MHLLKVSLEPHTFSNMSLPHPAPTQQKENRLGDSMKRATGYWLSGPPNALSTCCRVSRRNV
jgi:hypothetical protein